MELFPYKGLQDLYAMLDLLAEGRRAESPTYYVHRGDLQWWLFYTDVPQETWQTHIRLLKEGDRLLGWVLLSFDVGAFDVYVDPVLQGTPREYELLAWAVGQLSAFDEVQTVWIAEHDAARIHWLVENGFSADEEHLVLLKRVLSGPLAGPALPDGFSLRSSRGEADARLRSVVSHAAFGSKKPFEEYWPRTLRFMQSAVYVPEHEIFVISPDERAAAFCIIWTDGLNKIGLFEPVGTHPDFQRMGLGKSLLFEGLRRLKAEGMSEASVCAVSTNPAAIHLYESIGFEKSQKLLTYTKRKS